MVNTSALIVDSSIAANSINKGYFNFPSNNLILFLIIWTAMASRSTAGIMYREIGIVSIDHSVLDSINNMFNKNGITLIPFLSNIRITTARAVKIGKPILSSSKNQKMVVIRLIILKYSVDLKNLFSSILFSPK